MMTSIPPCRRCATYRRTFLVPRSSPTIRYVSSSFCSFGAVFLAGPSGMVLLSAAAVVCVDREFKMRDPCRGSRHGISLTVSCVIQGSATTRHHEGAQRPRDLLLSPGGRADPCAALGMTGGGRAETHRIEQI